MSFLQKRQEEKIIYGRKSIFGIILLLCGAVIIVACAYEFFSIGGIEYMYIGVGLGCLICGALIHLSATKELEWIKQQEEREAVEKYQ